MSGISSSLSEQAASRIMDMILVERRFQTGDKLPNEMELAQELGISRVTLREAVRILCTRGLVEIKRGKGTYVTNLQIAPDGDLSMLEALGASHRDMLEIRMMVEPAMAYYAAKRATPEQVETIDALRIKIEEMAAAGENFLKVEQDFHNAIALASQNQFIKTLMPIINHSIYNDITLFEDSITYSLQDHREISHCIRTHNAEGARTIMQMHIIHAYQISDLEYE